MKYQLHLDTSVSSNVQTGGMAAVYKQNGNPFLSSILLGNRHRKVNTVELKSVEIPVGFYNIRAPYNTLVIDGLTYTVPPGNYASIDALIDAINLNSYAPALFSRIGSTLSIEFPTAPPESVPAPAPSGARAFSVDLAWSRTPLTAYYSIESNPPTTTQTTQNNSYTFTGLEPDTVYSFQVNAVNSAGTTPGGWSDDIQTLPGPPDAVTDFIASNPTPTTVDLTWTAPPTATSYSIVSSPETPTQTTSDPFFLFPDLTPGTEYTFTITPINSVGYGPSTTTAPISTIPPVPPAVSTLTASNATNTTVDLSWTPAATATSYTIQSSPFTPPQTTSDTALTITDLTYNTTYIFWVTPTNASGSGPLTYSNYINTTGPAPSAVATITPTLEPELPESAIQVAWTPAAEAANYSLSSTPPSQEYTTEWVESILFVDLTPNTQYTFTITPMNLSGSGPSTTSDPISTLLPYPGPAPAIDDTPLAATKTTIEFGWLEDYIPEYADSYKVYCRGAGTYEVLDVQTCPLTPNYYTFTGLQTNYGYYFELSSVGARGEQQYASASSANMYTIPTVTGVSAGNPTETTVDITWDAPAGNLSPSNFNYFITSNPETPTQYCSGQPPYTFTDLTPDTAYTFTVTPQVGSDLLAGDPVTSGSVSTLLPLPGNGTEIYEPPTNITETSMEIAWDPVPYASSYELYAYYDGQILGPITVTSNTYTWTGLTPNTGYGFNEVPVNATGSGIPSTPTVPFNTLPETVTGFTASNPSETTVDLSWAARSVTNDTLIIEATPPISYTQLDGTATNYTVENLTGDTEYTFTITPQGPNYPGQSTISDPITTLKSPLITDFIASDATATTVQLNWTPPPRTVDHYTLRSDPVAYFIDLVGDSSSWNFDVTGVVEPGTYITFYLYPFFVGGTFGPEVASNTVFLTPVPGGGPGPNNTFTDLTTTTIGVSWDGSAQYATSYNVYAYVAVSDELVGHQNTPASPYIYTGLQPNYAYYFKITGVNASGEGEPGPGSQVAWTVPEVTGLEVGNPSTTTVDLTWDAPDDSVMNNIQWEITTTPISTTQTASAYNSFPIPYTFTGLDPGTEYTFTVTPQVGPDYLAGATVNSDPISTLIQVNLTYTGAIQTMDLDPGTYTFEMGGGSGPTAAASSYTRYDPYDPFPNQTTYTATGGYRSYFTIQYTIASPITIQYAIGQAAPSTGGWPIPGGAGGTYIYDQTNSQMLFVAGGAGAGGAVSGRPDEVDPGDGSGGAAGSGGGSGAGVNSDGSNSTANGGSGGLTFGNGAYGGGAGGFGTPASGGFGGGGGGTWAFVTDLGNVFYPGGGGGYTGGTTETIINNSDPLYGTASGTSMPGTSYMISGSTLVNYYSDQNGGDGFINITGIQPISATGGTITTYSSDGTTYKVHAFTSSDTFTVINGGVVDVLCVGGGGAGSISSAFFYEGTGGGGGGEVVYATSVQITPQNYPIIVGLGGTISSSPTITTTSPQSSSALGITANPGNNGDDFVGGTSGSGNIGGTSGYGGGAGGGGNAQVGYSPSSSNGANGGNGSTNSITGTEVYFGGGGGGGTTAQNNWTPGLGGLGGGGTGAKILDDIKYNGTNGTPGSGGGGGGGTTRRLGMDPSTLPGSGGSGVVLIRYII